MKIVQVMPEFGLAGAERMAESLTLQLKKEGYEVEVVSLYDYHSDITENLERNGVKIHYFGKKKGMDLSMFLKLLKLFRQLRPDVVHTHRYVSQYTMPICILTGVPVRVHTVHSLAEKEKIAKKPQKIFYRCFRLQPVSINEAVKESISRQYNIKTDRIPMVYNGVDIKNYIKKDTYTFKRKFRVVHIGRFTLAKNHIEMIHAFKTLHSKHPETELHLYGTGELKENAVAEINKLGLQAFVILHGVVNNINEIMHKYDMFMLPSIYEGMPITIIEAMASGMPILATNVGGIPNIITDEYNGILVNTDSESIACGLERMYYDAQLRESLGRAALKSAVKYSVQNMTKGYIEIYKG